MDYFAGLDTLDGRDPRLRRRSRRGWSFTRARRRRWQGAIAVELAKAPSCRRIVFETGRMAADPVSRVGANLGLPVVCVERRQAYQALKSLATHKTDRNDAREVWRIWPAPVSSSPYT